MIVTIIAFIVVLGVLVLAHEFGHFIAAKKSGVLVQEFAIGFPPRLLSIKRGETKYSINLFPLGGYVKMLGELEHSSSPRAFENQSTGKRFIISVAGVLMNLVLAWFLLTVGFSFGMSPLVTDPAKIGGKVLSSEVLIAGVEKDSVAEKNEVKPGDTFVSGQAGSEKVNFKRANDLTDFDKKHKGQEVEYTISRDSNEFTKKIVLADKDEAQLGAMIAERSVVRVPFYRAPIVALQEVYGITKLTVEFLGDFFGKLFSSGKVSDQVGGPVAIYMFTGLAVKAGVMALLQFIVLLSINLALINILPFPALDGGRIIFILLEAIFGKKVVHENVENVIHTIGFALLILLIVAITYKDIVRLF